MRKFITSLFCISPLLIPIHAWATDHHNSKHQLVTVEKKAKRNKHNSSHKPFQGPQGPKGQQGPQGPQGQMGAPAIVAYGQVSTEVLGGKEIAISEPGAVPMNKPAQTSNNVSYDEKSHAFTVREAGTYMIDYFLQAQYHALPMPTTDGVLSIAVEINGKNEGDSQLYPTDVRFNQYFILVGSGSRRLIKELPAGSTIRLVIATVPKLEDASKGITLFNNGTGPDTSAYISLVKVG